MGASELTGGEEFMAYYRVVSAEQGSIDYNRVGRKVDNAAVLVTVTTERSVRQEKRRGNHVVVFLFYKTV